VDATFKPNLITVAKRTIMGKEEKSIGVAVWIATIIINRAKMMLNVNKTSNIIGGIGKTSRDNTSSTMIGVTRELSGNSRSCCRKLVNVKRTESITH
tara:strand:- start:657 stop:947 length:291 start_codon:yes stop_codon:yes gene_type:complete